MKLREVFGETARVARPVVRGEIRIFGLDDSVMPEEVCAVIAREGKCLVGEVRAGPIRLLNNGLGSVWAQCPLAAALAVSRLGKIRIGWTIARVELLKSRPRQCYKCWRFGHVRFACKAASDRSGLCFRCGAPGHMARDCNAAPKCLVCADLGRECAHRVGSTACSIHAEPGLPAARVTMSASDGAPTRRVEPLEVDHGN